MISPVTVYWQTPKELVVMGVKVDGVTVTTGYQVCILPLGVEPDETTTQWQNPDTAGTDTGIFVGTDTTNVFAKGSRAQPWYWLVDFPESLIERCNPLVYFT